MTKPAVAPAPEAADLRTLVGDIVEDGKVLLGQQLDLFRAEVGGELRRAGTAAAAVAAGGGLTAASGFLGGLAVAHLLHKATGLPMWLSYGVVGGAAAAGGAALLRHGRDELAGLRPLPQSAAALGENLSWLKDQMSPTG